jgi:predicted chitinase
VLPLDLTPDHIAPAFPGAKLSNIEKFWPFVREALRENMLTDPISVATALGTIAAETAGFVPIKEMPSKYNTRIRFGDLYDGRKDLGNYAHGDGGKYCGRGFPQLTGRDNYMRYGARIGVDLLDDPEQANEPRIAAQLLAIFIADRRQKIEIDALNGDLKAIRRLVNGGSHGLDRFTKAYNTIMGELK